MWAGRECLASETRRVVQGPADRSGRADVGSGKGSELDWHIGTRCPSLVTAPAIRCDADAARTRIEACLRASAHGRRRGTSSVRNGLHFASRRRWQYVHDHQRPHRCYMYRRPERQLPFPPSFPLSRFPPASSLTCRLDRRSSPPSCVYLLPLTLIAPSLTSRRRPSRLPPRPPLPPPDGPLLLLPSLAELDCRPSRPPIAPARRSKTRTHLRPAPRPTVTPNGHTTAPSTQPGPLCRDPRGYHLR